MIEIHDELPDIPVMVDRDDDGDGDDGTTHVNVAIHRPDGSYLSASATVDGEADADRLACLILRAAQGAAAAHGTDTWIAVQSLITTRSST
ncbi:hypothetical protein [Saccharothrix texasensis]|uniref:Uncharacterized protein n=1 Tax=Saccharothrix texasensis TaxID=103734 RepID=A0A3N1H181_9PSEU|nr:hypothetical protein [Saccharothrix texasensis]ROP36270.1 hypothetical protein EDD40_1535 [Saccharothrix texasensis]